MRPYYGTVYKVQREHSLADIERYLTDIRNAGLDTVVIWPSVYWWEDRTAPGYPYNTGRHILKFAEAIGLSVIMETAGQVTGLEYAPDFVMKDEYYPVAQNGLRENRGNDYGYLNYFHPRWRPWSKSNCWRLWPRTRNIRRFMGTTFLMKRCSNPMTLIRSSGFAIG